MSARYRWKLVRQVRCIARLQRCGVPLDLNVRESRDARKLNVVNKPDTAAAQAVNQVAQQVAAPISVINLEE